MFDPFLNRFAEVESDEDAREPVLRGRLGEAHVPAQLWESVDRRLADGVPAIPLFNRQHLTLVSERVGHVQHHPLWEVLVDQLWVK